MRTRVVFRVWPDQAVIALFPDLDAGEGCCDSYEHVGQHGAADYAGVIRQTRPAKPAEYAALFRELETIGYTLRTVIRRTRT